MAVTTYAVELGRDWAEVGHSTESGLVEARYLEISGAGERARVVIELRITRPEED